MVAFEGAEGALEVLLDLGAVAEEVFVDEVVGVAGDVLHADGEALVRLRVGFRIFGAFGAFGEMHFVEGLKPSAFGAGEALGDPMTLDEALDQDLLGDALRLEIVEDGLLEFAVIVRVFERKDDGFGGEAVFEGVEAGFGFAFGGAGSSGLLRVAAVGRDLFCCGH